jgi:hypothetical protein
MLMDAQIMLGKEECALKHGATWTRKLCNSDRCSNKEARHVFYLTTHDYVVILCVPPTFAIPAFVVVVWVREVSPFSRRKASVFVQVVVW